RKELRYQGADEELLRAWNAMLLDVPARRLDLLVQLRLHYKTFLRSNTNETHVEAFERELYRQHAAKNYTDYLKGINYSWRLGISQPDEEIFHTLLKKPRLAPSETIFIDDTEQHVRGAGRCGIKSYLLPKNMEVGDLLKELRIL